MTLDFARKQRFKIVPKRVPFELANGSVQYSIGYTLLSCALTRDQQKTRPHEFYIFATCIEPLILGRSLLYDVGILRPPVDRHLPSLFCDKEENSLVGENPLGETVFLRPKVRIHLRHSGGIRKILAVPDKGSDVNVMSLAFAQSLGYNIDRQGTSQRTLQVANGLMIRSVGIVCASFEIDMSRARLDLMQKHFAVVVNFPFDIAFGNAFIRELKVFEANLSCLEWVHVREELPLLCPFMTAVHAGENCKKSGTRPTEHPTQQLLKTAADRVADMEAEENLKATEKAAEEKRQRQEQEEKWRKAAAEGKLRRQAQEENLRRQAEEEKRQEKAEKEKLRRQAQEEKRQKEAEEERSRQVEERPRIVRDEPANGGIENNETERKPRKNEKRREEERSPRTHFSLGGLTGIFRKENSAETRKDRQESKSKRGWHKVL
ncbi:hypothetical protein IMSHALPRED_007532 [Imshaugia aleurites]|uniref:Uncharacterized protein n=1 Tax=Imshaugia aleurites TaxID=172621 RepID=A0A8H3ELY2_9LECA|nr:hypothetical protein IMSHALPRED_007532 [Imshaugia aleurites]